ncbi:MAG: pyridoxal phosphate-dependent aminotransferase [Clostridiales Family XIII bacterium]|jgi:cystathionine beta-lyase|nr:pyridoxal phosphate-dependent aminotransferase [Clostridiales Family XIII bacterium]
MNDLDKIINRRGTMSVKYDRKDKDIIPLWIADMDFMTSPGIKKSLLKLVEKNIYGYAEADEKYFANLKTWMKKFHNFEFQNKEVVLTPGIVFALATAIKAYSKEGDYILIQKPVYYPFSISILVNGRKILNNPLVYDKRNNTYKINFLDFEKKIKLKKPKAFILCSPHNPVGKVWKKDELKLMSEICKKNNVIIISDEIHMDFAYGEHKHTVLSNVKKEFEKSTLILTAPSKAFNLAGLQISNTIIKNQDLREKFQKEIAKTGYSQLNIAGLYAGREAYKSGEKYFFEIKEYIYNNILFVEEYLYAKMPKAKLVFPEGTYLVWIDFSSYGFSDVKLNDLILHKAKVWLDAGTMFGKEGSGFQRINVACSRKLLKKALDRIRKVIENE